MSAYFCTSSAVCAGHDVYPTSESLDDVNASRTGIHHNVMYTTPSLPTLLSHNYDVIPTLSFLALNYIVLHIKMHIFT